MSADETAAATSAKYGSGGSSLRCFFRFAAYQGWCSAKLATGIELPRLYDLEDVPRAPTVDEVDKLLATTAAGSDALAIRDHAILLLLIHYGLRRGEVQRLTLDDLDWKAVIDDRRELGQRHLEAAVADHREHQFVGTCELRTDG